MISIVNFALSSLIQIITCLLIPFVFYLIKHRKAKGFWRYLGFFPTSFKILALGLIAPILISIVFLIIFPFLGNFINASATSPSSVFGTIRQLDTLSIKIVSILIIAWTQTSFSEEVIFRGFIGKRLINRLGFVPGNSIQAILFGLIHFLFALFGFKSGLIFALIFFLVITLGAYAVGYYQEKIANGSIFPSWISHALINTIFYTYFVFFI